MEQILNVLRCAGDEAARKAAMDAELGSWVQEVDHTFSAEEQQLIFRTSLQTLFPSAAAGLRIRLKR